VTGDCHAPFWGSPGVTPPGHPTLGLALDLEAFFAQQTAELEIPDPATPAVDPAALAWADRGAELAFTSRDQRGRRWSRARTAW
jgi:hypothetical protein